ncbi:hypothetical protein BV25DRAFT_1994769 [Artomyces pyxidatus]|uniref:Uncharacterized protein n=1 Tax=Artomyces pyxidatus TaxID=48021 RepID=A0ACB8SNE7_9AGAM|nr:hypothetical protein BV25DRAFT_1994769 [Artomyces pyxidatus]
MAPAQQLPTTNVVNLPRILPVLAIIFASVFLVLLIFCLLHVLIPRRQSSARSPPRQLILPITVLEKEPKRLSALSLLRASFAFSLARTSVDAVHDLPKCSTAEKLDMDFACRGLEHANGDDDDDEDATLDALESGKAATTTPLSVPQGHSASDHRVSRDRCGMGLPVSDLQG